MKIDAQAFASKLSAADDILILTHEQPDGDALGGSFALLSALRKLGKRCAVRYSGECPRNMEYITAVVPAGGVEQPALLVAVDVADLKLLGDDWMRYEGRIDLCADHHTSNTFYAKDTYLEDVSAASELVLNIIRELGIKPDAYIAACIYTGISTDTGCFRYPNTTARTLRTAADMIDLGADTDSINKLMFETKTKSFIALERLANDSLELHFGGKCALITITRRMFEQSGAHESECHPITASSRQIEGVLVGVVLKEQRDGSFNVSVRTNGDISAALICAGMGGGGHKNAAGCELDGSLEQIKLLILKNVGAMLDSEGYDGISDL